MHYTKPYIETMKVVRFEGGEIRIPLPPPPTPSSESSTLRNQYCLEGENSCC